jgi:EAL domain-containing protein (putative c-di-GMP-specific phosphodiesterase class I)
MIPPPITVSIAEDAGFIGHLGLFVIVEACSYRVSWVESLRTDVSISVNVSPMQLANPNFEQQVKDAITHSGLDPHMLVLEIVESSVIEPGNDIVTMFQRLQQMGIRLAIDDFGMGHASLRYLREFSVDTVKIDRSLTENSEDGVNDHIVRSIVDLSHSLKFSTVVEGVETEEQMKRFLALGCGTFQGYLFSRPLSGEDCLEFMKKWG